MVEQHDLTKNWIHLGLGATSTTEPPFTGMEWFADYTKRHEGDGKEGRLVTVGTFSESLDSWEMHPHGTEVVLCLEGEATLIHEVDGGTQSTTLGPQKYAINPPGVWHTIDVTGEAKMLFITAGFGTQHKPRQKA